MNQIITSLLNLLPAAFSGGIASSLLTQYIASVREKRHQKAKFLGFLAEWRFEMDKFYPRDTIIYGIYNSKATVLIGLAEDIKRFVRKRKHSMFANLISKTSRFTYDEIEKGKQAGQKAFLEAIDALFAFANNL